MPRRYGSADRVIGRIASRAWGIVTRPELLGAGLSDDEIRVRLARGSLLPEYPGVYRVGHRAPSVQTRYMAAVRAGGPEAVLSGRAAAHLLRLIRGRPPEPEVTTTGHRAVRGLELKRVRRLDPVDRTVVDGIAVTTPARTLVDLAAVLRPAELGRAVHEAFVIHRTTPDRIEAALARRPNSKGAAPLRRLIRGDAQVTLSKLERLFLRRLSEAGLPAPVTNGRVDGRYVDCRWPQERLTVELDGYAYHATRHAWEQDRRREREAYARGDQFRRYTWSDVHDDPRQMLVEMRSLLRG